MLSNGAIEILKKWKKEQSVQRLKIGDLWHDNDKIFTQWNGTTMHPDTISSWFKKFISKNNLRKVTLHSLRHANISLQLYMGVDPKTASVRAGHSNIGITMRNICSYAKIC